MVSDPSALTLSDGDPVRVAAPYVSTQVVTGQGGGIPLIGLLVAAGVLLWFEFMRKGGRRR